MEKEEENVDLKIQKPLKREIEARLPDDYRLAIKRHKFEDHGGRSWIVMLFLNGLIIIIAVGGSCVLKYLHNKYYEKLTLLDAYDDGSFITLTICVYLTCSVISFMGMLIISVAKNGSRRGRMRYMIYAYIGWTVAICVVVAGMAIQCIAVLFAMPSLFKDGIFMSMMLYGRIPEVAKKIQNLQMDLQCCGSFSFDEWFSITWSDAISKINLNLPKSCCDLLHYSTNNCIMHAPFQRSDDLTPWTVGCVERLEDAYKVLVIMSLSGFIVFFFIEFLLLIMSFINIPSIKNYETLIIEGRIQHLLKIFYNKKTANDEKEKYLNDK